MLGCCHHVTYWTEKSQGYLRVYAKGPGHLLAKRWKAGSPGLPLYKVQCKIAWQGIVFD